ncbi:hypothetical protein ONS95_003205 [Cadophora gregata]|uniref:uncharacterized protein n=1 Tax=Cadophora gregata TaxID=51156 RepID=UPI0026DCA95E|nr:uncharacterized protein ONS95_003205 [Cadophora gregata]KAK0108395.1 hypothetical protein ONS95_003205 [Cadophora gregata]KAK0109013.1 hypothetical protein ONS96_002847 [Cadophora gregata f. sp. sojae]
MMASADQNTVGDLPRPRGRARSRNVSTNPLDCPLSPEEEQLAIFIRQINHADAGLAKQGDHAEAPAPAPAPAPASASPRPSAPISTPPAFACVKALSLSSPQTALRSKMNYQNYIDSPGGSGSNPRQAPPSPSQGMPNGMNGGMGMGGGMVGYPTPAGHQSDLNYVMSMVEELSSVLKANAALTAGVVDKMGKVRLKAQHLNLTNDELVAVVASELNEDSKNLEKENSDLRKALELSDFDKKENFKLAVHGASILADITEKMHRYKEQHEIDTLAWHTNYRQQLEHEREENLKLRCQIDDMKAAACRANGHLRDMRHYLTDHDELNELRVQNTQYRQERRFWKRKALPMIPDDDPEYVQLHYAPKNLD